MDRPDYIPANYGRIKVVSSLSKLFNTAFGGPGDVNCVLYPRRLSGNFDALAWQLGEKFNRDYQQRNLTEDELRRIGQITTYKGLKKEIGIILQDMKILKTKTVNSSAHRKRYSGMLRVIGHKRYNKKDGANGEYIFHEDGGNIYYEERLLCCYNGPTTEFLRNEDALPYEDSHYRYTRRRGAKSFSMGIGDIWRHLTSGYSGNVTAFIHRAPYTPPNATPRLLLVAD